MLSTVLARSLTSLASPAMRRIVVGLVVVGALLAACGSESKDDPIPQAGGTGSTVAGQTTSTTAQAPEGPVGTCSYLGTDDLHHMQVEVVFTNTLGDINSVEVTFALLDPAGTRFFTGTAGGNDLQDLHFPKANEQFRVAVNTYEDVPPNVDVATVGCKVLGAEEGTDIGGYKRAGATDTCAITGRDGNDALVDLSVTSPYDKTTKVQVWWSMYGPGGVRFNTGTKVTDLVGAGETYKVAGEKVYEIPAWVGNDITCAVGGYWQHPSR